MLVWPRVCVEATVHLRLDYSQGEGSSPKGRLVTAEKGSGGSGASQGLHLHGICIWFTSRISENISVILVSLKM